MLNVWRPFRMFRHSFEQRWNRCHLFRGSQRKQMNNEYVHERPPLGLRSFCHSTLHLWSHLQYAGCLLLRKVLSTRPSLWYQESGTGPLISIGQLKKLTRVSRLRAFSSLEPVLRHTFNDGGEGYSLKRVACL